jgi:hypothetical protein
MAHVSRQPATAPDERQRGKLLDAAEVAEHRLGRLVRLAECDLQRFLDAHRLPVCLHSLPAQQPTILAAEEPHDDHHHYRLRTVTRWRQGTSA